MKHFTHERSFTRVFSFLMAVLMLATFMLPASAASFDDLASVTDVTDHGGESSGSSTYEPVSENEQPDTSSTESGEALEDFSSTGNETEENKDVATSGTTLPLGASGDEWTDPPEGFTFQAYSGNPMLKNDSSTTIGMIKDTSITHRYPFSGGTSMMPAYIFYTSDGRAAYCVEPARFNSYNNNYVTGSISFDSLSSDKQLKIARAIAANDKGYSDHAYYFATQAIIWEICKGEKYRTGSVYDAVIAANSAKLSSPYETILSKMDTMTGAIPSFMNVDKSNPTIHQMTESGGNWSIELNNTSSGVAMAASDFRSKAQLNFSVSGSKLTVTSSNEPDTDSFVEWQGGGGGTGLVFWNSDVQKKVSQAETGNLPSVGYMAFNAEAETDDDTEEEEEPKVGYLTIYKYNGVDNQPLGGAIFRIECDGFVDEAFPVAYGGATIVIPIPEGQDSVEVTVTEVSPPHGFVGDPSPKTVTVTANNIVNVAQVGFANYPEACSITIYKYEKGNYGKALEGAKFRIRYADPNVSAQVWTLTTDSSGKIHIDLPSAGTLIIEELEAPQGGYVIGEISTHDVTVIRGEDKRIDISNDKKAELVVYKKDAVTGIFLSGAVFQATLLESHTPPYEAGIKFTAESGPDGKAVFTGLIPGQWRVEELTPPQYYQPTTKVETVTILDGNQATVTLTFENLPWTGLTIRKVSAEDGSNLKGAIFGLYRGTEVHPTDFLGDYQSNDNGMVVIHKLEPGYYTVIERQPPANFLLDPDHHIQTIQIKPDAVEQNITIIFRNPPKPKILIEKTDENGKKLPNATFRLKRHGSIEYIDVTTGPTGTVLVEGLEDDFYEVVEIRSPEGFILNNEVHTIQLIPGKTVTLSVVNVSKPSFTLRKLDETTGRGLDGAVFRIWREGVDEHQDVTTANGGYLRLTNQEPGFVLVQEQRAPSGFVLDDTMHRIELLPGKNAEIIVKNRSKPKLTLRKIDEQTLEGIEGVCFRLSKDGEFQDVWTGKDGIVTAELSPGWWTIEEKSVPSAYILEPTPQYVELVAGANKEVIIKNRHKPSLKLIKLDSMTRQPMQDVRFSLKYKNGKPLGEYKTNAEGEIYLEDIDPGLLEITELPYDGYTPLEPYKEILVEWGKIAVVEFQNQPINPIIIKKIDENGAPVADTLFRINKINGEFVKEVRSGRNGFAVVTGVQPGFFQVIEVESAPGFILDSSVHIVELKYNEPAIVEIVNKKLNGIQIRKENENGEPLVGVSFTLKQKNGNLVGEYKTGQGGIIEIPDLSPGWYTIFETATLPDYLLDATPKDIELKWGDYASVTFINTRLSSFQARKLDSVTKEPIANIRFRVTKMNGELVGEYVTNTAGFFALDLEPGWYSCFETATIPGYLLDPTPQNFEIKKGKNVVLEFQNRPLSGLQIRKSDSVTSLPIENVEFRLTELDGRLIGNYKTDSTGTVYVGGLKEGYYILSETKGLPNYKPDAAPRNILVETGKLNIVEWKNTPYPFLEIIKTDSQTKQPIEGVRIRVLDRYGRELGIFTTNAQGKIVLSGMDEGKYFVQEVEAKQGYVLNSTVREVTLKYGETTVIELKNTPMASFRLKKISAETGKPIPGVRFLLKDMQNNLVGEYETDSTGVIELPQALEGKKYKLVEIRAASGFVLDDTVRVIELKAGETFEITIQNEPERGKIRIIKKAADENLLTKQKKGALLEGAVFEIVDKDKNVVDTITSDSRGLATSKALPLGRYAIREITSPQYYLLDDTVFYAEIKLHNDMVEFEVENEPADISVTVEKRGNAETLCGDTIRYDFSNISNTSNCELDEFIWHDALPTDAVRIQKLFTGTWNERLTYKVEYKTNLKIAYRTLQSGLRTNVNNELDMTPSALKLAGNEYVTDFRLVFDGPVKAGFKEVEAPFIFVKVLDDLPNEYRFVNRTDVSGRREDEYAYAKDAWTTIVYRANLKKDKLPKTGM